MGFRGERGSNERERNGQRFILDGSRGDCAFTCQAEQRAAAILQLPDPVPRLPPGTRSHKTVSALLLRLALYDRAEACEMIRAPHTEPRPGPTFTRSGRSNEIKSMKSNASSPVDGGVTICALMRERLVAIKITSVLRTTPRLDIRPTFQSLSRATSIHSMFRPSPSPESIAYHQKCNSILDGNVDMPQTNHPSPVFGNARTQGSIVSFLSAIQESHTP